MQRQPGRRLDSPVLEQETKALDGFRRFRAYNV